MTKLKLNEQPTRKSSENAQEDDQNDSRHDTDDSQARGKTEHAIAYDFSNHQHSDQLP